MSRPFVALSLAVILSVLAFDAAAQGPDESRRLRILVVNDDGYRAPGLVALVDSLMPLADVFVAAPLEQQSGTGHGITYRDPIKFYEFGSPQGVPWFAVAARPATVTRVALTTLMDSLPDLVVSGINTGDNVGVNAWVSGTVAAAREAALRGLPAIAVSANTGNDYDYYRTAAGWARQVLETLLRDGLVHAPLLLNVNVPAGGPEGVRVTTMSLQMGEQRYDRRVSPHGIDYLWDDWSPPETDDVESTDLHWFSRGFVTITPLVVDQTDAAMRMRLEGVFDGR